MKNILNINNSLLTIMVLLLFSIILLTDMLPAQERPDITLLPGHSAEYFYRHVPWPDGIAVRGDGSLLIVNEISPQGVFVANRGDEFDIEDAYCITGPPFDSPDDILQYYGDSVFVVDGQAQTLFLTLPSGIPISFVTPEDISIENRFNPFGIALAPPSFDGPDVDPGDLIIADIAFGWFDERAIWAVNPQTAEVKVLAQGGVKFDHGPSQVAFGPDGTLYMMESDASGNDSTRIVTIDEYGQVYGFLHGIPSSGNLSVHPVTGDVYFGINQSGEIRRISAVHADTLYPSTSEVFASGFSGLQDLQFSPDGEVLYVSAFFPTSNDIIAIRKTHTFTVTNTNENGAGSLRQAILDANAHLGLDSITFNIITGPAPPFDIAFVKAMPVITDPVIIDGTTQPGFVDEPVIKLSSPWTNLIHGLVITSGNSKVRGLDIEAAGDGIKLLGGSNNIIEKNFIHCWYDGISIDNSSNNLIGGRFGESSNFIYNSAEGIFITGNGASGNKVIGNIVGTNGFPPSGNNHNGIYIVNSPGNVIGGSQVVERNLISGNSQNGIRIYGPESIGNEISGNFIGTDISGQNSIPNQFGITIEDAPDNVIGGTTIESRNIISGNNDDGINILGSLAEHNKILGNFIGVAADGSSTLGNGDDGINIESPNNFVGDRNIISGNASHGIVIVGADAINNTIQGNYIGTDVTGEVNMGNNGGIFIGNGAQTNMIGPGNIISGNIGNGLQIMDSGSMKNSVSGNYIGTDGSGESPLGNGGNGVFIYNAPNNVIGGIGPELSNVISGNGKYGLVIRDTTATGNQVLGNFIGTDKDGTDDLGNAYSGIIIWEAPGNTIGDGTSDHRNIISGNDLYAGVTVVGYNARNNTIIGNYIGTDITGTNPIGNNGHGVWIEMLNPPFVPVYSDPPSNTNIESNIIAFNTESGVSISSAWTTDTDFKSEGIQNRITSNAIFSNGELGIDLGGNGVTPNDIVDVDTGPNNLQNYPVLTSAASDVDIISGELHSAPSTAYHLEFFSNDAPDSTGYGEGQTFIGSITVETDGYGDVIFNAFLPQEIDPGKFYTATATDPDNNTSEFSAAMPSEIKTKSFGLHYVVNRTHSGIPLHWPDGKATFNVSLSAQEYAPTIETSYSTWSALPELEYIGSGNSPSSNQWAGNPDGLNNNVWIADWNTTGLDQDVVAATRVRYNAITGEMTDVDIAYNADSFIWKIFEQADENAEELDVENVVTHEIGHFGGLGDIYNPSNSDYWVEGMGDGNEEQTMYGLIKAGETKKRDLYQYSGSTPEGDVAGIEYIYANIPDEYVDLMLVFDGSANYADNYHAFDAAKKSAIQLIDKMRVGDRVGIVKLPDTVVVTLTQIDENDRSSIKNAIAALNEGGAVAIGSGLQTAQTQLTANGGAQNKWAMILFSSGEETTAPYAESVLPDIVGTKTAVYTMGFADGPGAGQNLNSHIADVTRADYFLLADSSEIVDVVNFIWYRLLGMQILYLSEAHSTDELSGKESPGLYWQGGMYWQGGFYWQGGMYWQGGLLEIGLYWQGSDLDLSILPPPADSTQADRLIDSTNVNEYKNIEFFTGPSYEYFRIKNAEPGTWSGWVFGKSLPQTPETYRTYIAARTDVTMEVDIPYDRLPSGAHTEIRVKIYEGGERQSDLHLTGGQPLLGAIVSADIVNSEGDSIYTEPFYEAGEGLYTITTDPFTESGSYKIIINASKTTALDRILISHSEHSLFIYDLPSSDGVNEIRDAIFNLDNSHFKKPGANRKVAFSNKLDAVLSMIADKNYSAAINKLENDIIAKMDGFYDGNPKNDWIVTQEGQHAVYPLVRNLIISLQILLPKQSEPPALKIELFPRQFNVLPNFPNPFNLQTTIQYELPQESQVSLKVYNVLGQLVRILVDGYQESGYHTLRWDGNDEGGNIVSNGVYIYRFKAGNYIKTGKMLLMK